MKRFFHSTRSLIDQGRFLVWSLAILNLLSSQSWADDKTTSNPPCEHCDKSQLPFFDGLGTHSRQVSRHLRAQRYFDQGLAFLYAFNHDEATRSFEHSAKLDPECAMAEWGIALANGIHINKTTLPADRATKAWQAVNRAIEKSKGSNSADRAMIVALRERYSESPPADRQPLDRAYRQAMKKVWESNQSDADIGALYAESIMNLWPWDLWTAEGKPQPDTLELVGVIDRVLQLNPRHPLALHLYIHIIEASPEPSKGLDVADRLRVLQPGLGHMVHMPSHIDVRCGRWQQAVEANERAIMADIAYRKLVPNQQFYRFYMAHNRHMLAFAAMMQGQEKLAIQSVRTMLKEIPHEWVAVPENAALADGYLAAPLEVMIRFGKWNDILAEPRFPDGFPIAHGLWLHARGIAFAAIGKTTEARQELEKLKLAVKPLSPDATFGNNKAIQLFEVAELMLEGEILVQESKLTEGIEVLRQAVLKEDKLRFDEPPTWIVPVRHALGAFLLKANRNAEAEEVYRQDLKKWPNNGWSLLGLAKSLQAQGKTAEGDQVQQQFQLSWRHADTMIEASCLCASKRPSSATSRVSN